MESIHCLEKKEKGKMKMMMMAKEKESLKEDKFCSFFVNSPSFTYSPSVRYEPTTTTTKLVGADSPKEGRS